MSAIRKYMWVKSKKKKGRDILSRINSLQRPIRTTARCLKVHPSSGQETLSHVQVSSEMSLLLALTWIALGRTMYSPLTSEETYRRVETWQTNGRKEEGRVGHTFPPSATSTPSVQHSSEAQFYKRNRTTPQGGSHNMLHQGNLDASLKSKPPGRTEKRKH